MPRMIVSMSQTRSFKGHGSPNRDAQFSPSLDLQTLTYIHCNIRHRRCAFQAHSGTRFSGTLWNTLKAVIAVTNEKVMNVSSSYAPLAKLLARQARLDKTGDGRENHGENHSSIWTANQRQISEKCTNEMFKASCFNQILFYSKFCKLKHSQAPLRVTLAFDQQGPSPKRLKWKATICTKMWVIWKGKNLCHKIWNRVLFGRNHSKICRENLKHGRRNVRIKIMAYGKSSFYIYFICKLVSTLKFELDEGRFLKFLSIPST